jgi:hypothetical protein
MAPLTTTRSLLAVGTLSVDDNVAVPAISDSVPVEGLCAMLESAMKNVLLGLTDSAPAEFALNERLPFT